MPRLAPITRSPTTKQQEIIQLLRLHSKEGIIPSSRQLAAFLDTRQTSAYGQIVALARRGLLERVEQEKGKPYYRLPKH